MNSNNKYKLKEHNMKHVFIMLDTALIYYLSLQLAKVKKHWSGKFVGVLSLILYSLYTAFYSNKLNIMVLNVMFIKFLYFLFYYNRP